MNVYYVLATVQDSSYKLFHLYNVDTQNFAYFKTKETEKQSINYVTKVPSIWQRQDLKPSGVILKPTYLRNLLYCTWMWCAHHSTIPAWFQRRLLIAYRNLNTWLHYLGCFQQDIFFHFLTYTPNTPNSSEIFSFSVISELIFTKLFLIYKTNLMVKR